METMYANRISITTNETEAFLRFDCLAPEYDENNVPIGQKVAASREIIISINALPRIRDVLNEMLDNGKDAEE